VRPVRIEVEGFSAYRERVEVDFEGVDFFSLAGPTGSGKSSLVDAMVFALYGRVPRLGGNAVAPAITAGTDRARVRFFFEVDDVTYDATRMAQRTSSGGANVKEARLQKGDSVLADGPGDVTAEVESLLRLGFDDFTRTVVLPQGEFARFLKATKAERQGLLRNLLGLDVFTKMRELARTRAAVATETAENARRTLDALDLPDEESRETALRQRDALEQLNDELPGREKTLGEMDRAVEEARSSVTGLNGAITRLAAIEEPPRLEELETLAADARSRVVDARETHRAAVDKVEAIEERSGELPTREQVAAWIRARDRLAHLDERLADDGLENARVTLRQAESRLEEGLASLERARRAGAKARTEHSAHLLAGSLVAGEPCPVCAQTVTQIPDLDEVPALTEVEAEETRADAEVSRLRAEVDAARTALATVEAGRAGLFEQRESVMADLTEAPDDLESLQAELQRLTTEMEEARKGAREAAAAVDKSQRELEDLADASRRVAKSLTEAQLTVADLEPPISEADDVTVQWKELIAWRDQTIERLRGQREEAAEMVATAEATAGVARQELISDLKAHGVEATEPFAAEVATALQKARSVVESHEQAAERSVSLATEIEDAVQRAAVAKTLSEHLQARGFERWLMAGALVDLVNGANDLLDQLSDGGYSLHSDESGSFSIVDHRNADEMRRVETLSGGETFLVSLALALSLAETLAAKGGSGLDAIILDEGFGTLDDESLDTVASVLEELTGKGLMVGVITHVKELAARAPVRYEVVREPRGAKVRLVS
jgi:exonuclease SbcC